MSENFPPQAQARALLIQLLGDLETLKEHGAKADPAVIAQIVIEAMNLQEVHDS